MGLSKKRTGIDSKKKQKNLEMIEDRLDSLDLQRDIKETSRFYPWERVKRELKRRGRV